MNNAPEQGALERVIAALLFLSPEPLGMIELVEATEASEQQVASAVQQLQARYAPGASGIVLRELAGGFTFASDPIAEPAAKRLFGRERRASLTQAQAETLAIVAYLQPVSRPEIARIRGVSADWAITALLERDLVEEAGRSELGATLYRTTGAFLKHFGLRTLEELPAVEQWDPTPHEASELRERLLRAGDARAGGTPAGAQEALAAGQDAQQQPIAAAQQPAQSPADAEQQPWPTARRESSGPQPGYEPDELQLPGSSQGKDLPERAERRPQSDFERSEQAQQAGEPDDEAPEATVLPLNRWERELLAE